MSNASDDNNALDENKLDFHLLTLRNRQLRHSERNQSSSANANPASISTTTPTSKATDTTTTSRPDENLSFTQESSINVPDAETNADESIWPLHLAPTFINFYITGEVIGNGSYAEVRECVDMRSLSRNAMKIINKTSLMKQAPRALANQLREISLLRHMEHANIISMRECIFKGDYIYIILDYCPFSVSQLLDDQVDGKFHVSIGRRFFYQLCSAVYYLHSFGIVHRDIKPQNMLLTNCGHLKLIDFGVSHILSMWDRSELCNNYEGSPLFQAPEIVVGEREYNGFKADIWSCGVNLYLMLYGKYPFVDEALLGLYDKILGEDLVIPDCQPSSSVLNDLLVQMLDKDCKRRITIEQVRAHPWMKLLGAANECDELKYAEFFDLVVKRHDDEERWSQLYATSQQKDMYKSMTVLPYLYKHHFPELPIRKTRRTSSVDSNASSVMITKINSLNSSGSESDATTAGSRTSSDRQSPNSSDPNEILDEDSQQIEWGTRAQYHLMKVPQIRANRVRCGASTKFKKRLDKARGTSRKSI